MVRSLNLEDMIFSRLLVIKRLSSDKYGKSRWLCQCDCGNEVVVTSERLTSKRTQSCGCYCIDRIKEANTGIIRSSETRKKISDSTKKAMNNPIIKKKISDTHKGKIISDETKRKMSISTSGKLNPMYGIAAPHGKGKWFHKKNGSRIWARSTWEYRIFKILDDNNIFWISELPITMKNCIWRPDIYIPSTASFIEIKGLLYKKSKQKMQAFADEFPYARMSIISSEKEIKMIESGFNINDIGISLSKYLEISGDGI
jgi:hypothetical protein